MHLTLKSKLPSYGFHDDTCMFTIVVLVPLESVTIKLGHSYTSLFLISHELMWTTKL